MPTPFLHTPIEINIAYLAPERLALKWIQKYISAFGGDPTKVTMCVRVLTEWSRTSSLCPYSLTNPAARVQMGRECGRDLGRAAHGRERGQC